MSKQEKIKATGKVVDCKPNAKFSVEVLLGDEPHEVEAHLSGKLRVRNLQVTEGDVVEVGISPYDLNRGIINERLDT